MGATQALRIDMQTKKGNYMKQYVQLPESFTRVLCRKKFLGGKPMFPELGGGGGWV